MSSSRSPRIVSRRGMLQLGISLVSGVGALGLLQACSGQPIAAPSPAAPTSAPVQPTVVPATTSQAVAGTVQDVVWLVPEDPLIDAYARDGVVPGFAKKQPNIHVQVVTPGSTDYGVKFFALIAGGQVPEAFTDWGSGTSFYGFLHRQILMKLTPYFQQANVDPNYILSVYRDEYSVSGQLYAIPWNSNPVFIVYNKTLFQQYGVPLPPADWQDKSWNTDKLLQTAQALAHKTDNVATSTWGLIMDAGTCGSLSWIWNADPFNNTGGPEESPVYRGETLTAVYPTRQEVVAAMTWLADLTNKHHVSPTPTDAKALSAHGNPIFSGRVGMSEQPGGWLERQAAVVKPTFEWGIAPFPYGPGGRHTMQREDNAWYVGQKSKNPEAGFQLLSYASQSEGANLEIEIAKDNPPIQGTFFDTWASSIVKIPGFSMTASELKSVFQGGIQEGRNDPGNVLDNSGEYGDAFTQLMASVWVGHETPQEGLAKVKAKWEQIMTGGGA